MDLNPLRPVVGTLVGALLGFAWDRFVGCRTGSCAITSKWWTSTLYGALMGLLASPP